MHLSWLVRLCIYWVFLLKIIVVRCWIISRLSYLFISCVWFQNYLVGQYCKNGVFGLNEIVDDCDYSILHYLM